MSRLLNDPAFVGMIVAFVTGVAAYIRAQAALVQARATKEQVEAQMAQAQLQAQLYQAAHAAPGPTLVQVPAGATTVHITPQNAEPS